MMIEISLLTEFDNVLLGNVATVTQASEYPFLYVVQC